VTNGIIPDIGHIRKPLQVLRHCAETDKETAKQKNWNRQNWTEKHCRLQANINNTNNKMMCKLKNFLHFSTFCFHKIPPKFTEFTSILQINGKGHQQA